jgi:hypothetical protein
MTSAVARLHELGDLFVPPTDPGQDLGPSPRRLGVSATGLEGRRRGGGPGLKGARPGRDCRSGVASRQDAGPGQIQVIGNYLAATLRPKVMRHRPLLASIVLVVAITSACGVRPDGSGGTSGGPRYAVSGYAHAGPTCPVEQNPPGPSCADRPVAGAVLAFRAADGRVVAQATTGPDGSFIVTLAPGRYTLIPQPVDGLMGTAAEQDLLVIDAPLVGIDLSYDTGIR